MFWNFTIYIVCQSTCASPQLGFLHLPACCCCFVLEGWSKSRELTVMGSQKKQNTKARVHTVILTWVVQTRALPAYTSLPTPVLVILWVGSREAACTKTLSSGEVRIRGFRLSITFHLIYLACYLKC